MINSEQLNNRTELIIERLDEALERLATEKIHLLGHGTLTKEVAENILKTGLKSYYPDLFRAAKPLSTLADEPDALARNKEAIEDWGHRSAKYIVLLGVERLEDEDIKYRYTQSVMQPNIEDSTDSHTSGIIDRRFMAGYIDTTNGTFICNPDFDPRYDPALYETTADEKIRARLDAVPIAEWMGAKAVNDHRVPAEPRKTPEDDLDNWF